ncbi:MAG: hypothetical protein WDN45_13940 [Caulobacteraceae bacterium]
MLENRRIRVALAGALKQTDIPVLAPASLKALELEAGGAAAVLADGRRLAAPLVVGGGRPAGRRRAGWREWGPWAGPTGSRAW